MPGALSDLILQGAGFRDPGLRDEGGFGMTLDSLEKAEVARQMAGLQEFKLPFDVRRNIARTKGASGYRISVAQIRSINNRGMRVRRCLKAREAREARLANYHPSLSPLGPEFLRF